MNKRKEISMCFALGAVVYGLVEVIARGYTHWTMLLTAGMVMVLFYLINQSSSVNIYLKCLIGCFVITCFELGVGLIVNVRLGWNVWDYSDKMLNLMGQICPQFSLWWLLISLPGFRLCDAIDKNLNKSGLISLR